jgi:serine/threonine protein kinase
MSRTLLPLRVRCELALGAANGLAYLHELRIVHFDLKPDNLLLDAPPGVVRAAAESGSEELPPPKFVTSPRALTSPGDSSGRGAAAAAAADSNASSQQEPPGGLARGGSGLGSNTSPGSATTGPRVAGGGGSGTRRNSSGPGVTRTGSGLMESSELPVVKVADFGLSKHKLNSSYVSSCRDLRGTLPYMAPELVSDPERVCEKADVWSLGVVMWEMMTRETPFQVCMCAFVCARAQGLAAVSACSCCWRRWARPAWWCLQVPWLGCCVLSLLTRM